jgi:hypothetical protein
MPGKGGLAKRIGNRHRKAYQGEGDKQKPPGEEFFVLAKKKPSVRRA